MTKAVTVNLSNATVKNYHILRFGVFWDPRSIFSQANNTRRIEFHEFDTLEAALSPVLMHDYVCV